MTECMSSACPCWNDCERRFEGPRCEAWEEHRQEVRDMMREANRRMRDRMMMRMAIRLMEGKQPAACAAGAGRESGAMRA